ncbi:hypothetical protein [Flagellimonas sp.]
MQSEKTNKSKKERVVSKTFLAKHISQSPCLPQGVTESRRMG